MFDIHDDYINVVIPFNKEVMEEHCAENGVKNGTLNGTLTGKEQLVLNTFLENGGYTIDDVSKKTAIPLRTVTRVIAALVEKQYLMREGSRRDGRWIVMK